MAVALQREFHDMVTKVETRPRRSSAMAPSDVTQHLCLLNTQLDGYTDNERRRYR